MPRLVAPRPVYANASALALYDSNRSGITQSPEVDDWEERQEAQLQLPTLSRPSSSLRALADPDAILPIQGGEEDVAAAVEKLERMKRASQSRRIWKKKSGYDGLTNIASAGGKRRDIPKRHVNREAKDDDSIILAPRSGEVKLGISGFPGYSVLAAQRAKFHLMRSNTFLETASNGRKEKDDAESDSNDKVPYLRSLTLRSKDQRHRQRKGSGLSYTETEKVNEAGRDAQMIGKPLLLSTEYPLSVEHPLANHESTEPPGTLTSVAKGVQSAESVKSSKRNLPTLITQNLTKKNAVARQRPLLMVQSSTEAGLEPCILEEIRSEAPSAQSSLTPGSVSENGDNCDADAQVAAEACQRQVSHSNSVLAADEAINGNMSSSSTSSSSDEEGSASGSEGSDLPVTQQEEYLLNLEHGEELTKKERKRMLHSIRHEKSGSSSIARQRGDSLGFSRQGRRLPTRKGTISNKVQSGLYYASSQSRNRRAMERFSPHPSRPSSTVPQLPVGSSIALTAIGDNSRSSTPVLNSLRRYGGMDSQRSSVSDLERIQTNGKISGTEMEEGDYCMSPVVENLVGRSDGRTDGKRTLLERQNTSASVASTINLNIPSLRKRYLAMRRKGRETSDVVEESDSEQHESTKQSAEHELENVLRNLVAQQAPEELGERFEYDVLYENQRGLMVFGIPKFSAKTLFQWDPNAWTNAANGNSAYNIANAQLPDPSWEWVHPEWLIDMSGDVDESGWQYGHHYGRTSLPFSTKPSTSILPRMGLKGNEIMNAREEKKISKRREKEQTREDDGFEALKRTARTRSAKWTGNPNQNTYVRRRRWIRLRRRKALVVPTMAPLLAATPNGVLSTPSGVGKASGDWAQLVEEERTKEEKRQNRKISGDAASLLSRSSSSSSSDKDTLSDLESDDTESYASKGEGPSAFLPRQTAGNLSNGADPTKIKMGKEQRRQRRHTREFTGTLQELKTLLPAIFDHRRNHSKRLYDRQKLESEMWLSDIDARNPFFSWNFVKKRLNEDDLAFASTSLRSRERRFAQKSQEEKEKEETRMRVLSYSGSRSNLQSSDREGYDHTRERQTFDLTKDALVEINFRRVMRVMKACKLDRQKLLLWRIWLGVEPVSSIVEVAREEDLAYNGVGSSIPDGTTESLLTAKKDAARQAKGRWRKAASIPDTMDVWDLLERELDRVLLSFEYQGTRASLLLLLLTLHAKSHANHHFKQDHWTIEASNGQAVEPNAPLSLSPMLGSTEGSRGVASCLTAAGDDWRAANLPRLEFWSDLEKCAKALMDIRDASSAVEAPSHRLAGRYTPQLSTQRGSPALSVLRSSTPKSLAGSLANGPTSRRYTQPSFAPPSRPSSAFDRGTLTPSSSNARQFASLTTTEKADRDRALLADLLQSPLPSRKERPRTSREKKTDGNAESSPSNLIRKLTLAAEQDGEY
ncbi:hypothetical protein CBS101457_002538 [Exobasidium rhododendri]|nr:hypothetical protein CBS101457_002538 [Exobasidium rhododendri]